MANGSGTGHGQNRSMRNALHPENESGQPHFSISERTHQHLLLPPHLPPSIFSDLALTYCLRNDLSLWWVMEERLWVQSLGHPRRVPISISFSGIRMQCTRMTPQSEIRFAAQWLLWFLLSQNIPQESFPSYTSATNELRPSLVRSSFLELLTYSDF